MPNKDFFDGLINTAYTCTSFALIGGDCDELMRFLQLEWESFDPSLYTKNQYETFIAELKRYKQYRGYTRNWKDDFSERNFTNLVV